MCNIDNRVWYEKSNVGRGGKGLEADDNYGVTSEQEIYIQWFKPNIIKSFKVL